VSPGARGFLLVLEGIDGCGKSTLARRLVERFQAEGTVPVHLREPGSSHLGETLRRLLLDPATGSLDARAEALLFMACRAELAAAEIRPALARGGLVLCERFHPSTICYQGEGLGLGRDAIRALAAWSTPDLEPDLVVLLDLPVALALARLGASADRMEGRGVDYLERVRGGYLAWAAETPRVLLLDATRPSAELADRVVAEVHRGWA